MTISKYWIINLSLASFDANVSSVSLISEIALEINTPINNWSLLVYFGDSCFKRMSQLLFIPFQPFMNSLHTLIHATV